MLTTAIANLVVAFPGTLTQFAPSAEEWSRHDSSHAPDIPQRTGHNPGVHPMTLCLPLTWYVNS